MRKWRVAYNSLYNPFFIRILCRLVPFSSNYVELFKIDQSINLHFIKKKEINYSKS